MSIEWLKAAKDDIYVLDDIIDNVHLTNMIAFHAQQSIEKSLKAVIAFKEMNIPRIHSLNRLFNVVNIDLEIDIEIVNKLDKLYIDSRYPGDMGLLPYGKPTMDDAKEFYDFANNIFNRVCEILEVDINEVTK